MNSYSLKLIQILLENISFNIPAIICHTIRFQFYRRASEVLSINPHKTININNITFLGKLDPPYFILKTKLENLVATVLDSMNCHYKIIISWDSGVMECMILSVGAEGGWEGRGDQKRTDIRQS